MAQIAVSFALQQLTPLLTEEANLLRDVHKEVENIRDELESIRGFLKDADTRAAAEGNINDGVKAWVKQVTKIAFRIEDVIDKSMIYMPQQQRYLGCTAASLQQILHSIRTLKHRRKIAAEIQDIKSVIQRIKERSERYGFHISFDQGSYEKSSGIQDIKWHDSQMASLFIEEAEVVGFEAPRAELIGWLVEGAIERTVISVVGMGGAGKTTLAKKAFDSKEVTGHFDCRACLTLSQSYKIGGLLREMMKQFSEAAKEPLPGDFDMVDNMALITQLRNYLQQKRYVVLLDDVWKVEFWDEIELALPNNDKGSRIIFTTRMLTVPEFCKKSSHVFVHNLQPLPFGKAWELFCKKAFRFGFDSHCPVELKDLSTEIVRKCQGLPLAIVAVGGLLSTKEKTIFEWHKLHRNISSELESNSHLSNLKRILALSYDDLPFYLKPCFLHFGISPENYSIYCQRLIMQWIAEGFIQHEKGKTLEEIGEQYLTELIQRSLVQVSKFGTNGKARKCQVHDLLREMIINRMEELDFCHVHVADGDLSTDHKTIRRLSISTNSNDFLCRIGSSNIRSMYIFGVEGLLDSFWSDIFARFQVLKVLDFEYAPLAHIPNKLGNLLHLRYLSLKGTKVQRLPRTIGKLHNLETLDLSQTLVRELPGEINKLRKLRHLMVYHINFDIDICMSWEWETGVKMMDKNITGLTSLQTLYNVEVDHGGVELIKELQKLRQLRELCLLNVRREYGKALCTLINEKRMKHLQHLWLYSIAEDEIMDLNLVSSPPQLQLLNLKGRLEKLPDWVPRLEYLAQLNLSYSKLTDDPLKLLKGLPNLLYLYLSGGAYEGENLHFEEGGFRKLKTLKLRNLRKLESIYIDKGALPLLQRFEFGGIPQLKEVPSGIRHLQHLQSLHIHQMPHEFNQSIMDSKVGPWSIQHVPIVHIYQKTGPGYFDYETRTIRGAGHS